MATASKTYTFMSGTPASAAQVNQNFDDVLGFINSEVIQRDGSKVMTNPLSLSGDPSTANHATRKQYVDTQVAAVSGATTVGRVAGGTLLANNAALGAAASRNLFTHTFTGLNGTWYSITMANTFVLTTSDDLPTTHQILLGGGAIGKFQGWHRGSVENSIVMTAYFQGTGAPQTITGQFVNRHSATIGLNTGWYPGASEWNLFRMGA